MTDGCDISREIALKWTSLDLNDDKSTLVHVMAWCRQATSHYLNQWWPRSLPPCGVTRPQWQYCDSIMGTVESLITSLTIVYTTVYSDADQSKLQSSASLAFVWGIHWGQVNSLHKWPVTWKMFPFDDVIMELNSISWTHMSFNINYVTLVSNCFMTYDLCFILVISKHYFKR